MSVCSPCFDSSITVDDCFTTIEFGVVEPNTEYQIDIKHNATSRVQSYQTTSDANGMLQIFRADFSFDPNQCYTISLRNCATFLICEVEYTCISFCVSKTDLSDTFINLLECVEC